MSKRRQRRKGGSVQKKLRDQDKREKKGQKRPGKPSGQAVKGSETWRILKKARVDPKKQVVELRQIGGGRVPKITVEVLAKLRKLESTSLGKYSYTVVRHRSDQSRVCFEVGYGLDLSSRRGKHFGCFEIDLERKTIRKVKREN